MFATPGQYSGSVGGLAGADAICQSMATDAGLPGTFLAWLSTKAENDPESRFNHSILPYVRADGVRIADNWTDLVDGTIQSDWNIGSDGNVVAVQDGLMTATQPNGQARLGNGTCLDFTSAAVGQGAAGANGASALTINYLVDCSRALNHLLCVQQ